MRSETLRESEGAYRHKQNAVRSERFLAALKLVHGGDFGIPQPAAPEPIFEAEPAPLPPIPNEVISKAADVAFPSWVSSIKRIQSAVCAEYSISLSLMCSQRRHRTIVRPRQIAMYLCKHLTDRSFPEIGRRFGGRDHSTVISAVKRVEQICAVDETFRIHIGKLAESLEPVS